MMKNLLLLCSTMAITTATILKSFDEGIKALKKAVPKGVSPSPSQELLQKLKREIQRKAPLNTLHKTFTAYRGSLNRHTKKGASSHILPLSRKSMTQFEDALKRSASYPQLERLFTYIEKYK